MRIAPLERKVVAAVEYSLRGISLRIWLRTLVISLVARCCTLRISVTSSLRRSAAILSRAETIPSGSAPRNLPTADAGSAVTNKESCVMSESNIRWAGSAS